MTEHTFGGDWTDVKLSRLKKYLNAYRQIFTRNPAARYLKTWYVDAFAGTGSRTARKAVQEPALFADVYEDIETTQYQDGSAKIALSLSEPFERLSLYRQIESPRHSPATDHRPRAFSAAPTL